MSSRKRINNPYPPEGYKCFACSPSNPIGLQLSFEADDTYVYATWEPGENFQGYNNVIHGGVIATLLDEVAAWYISVKVGTAGVTKSLRIEYLKPLYLTRGPVELRARMIKDSYPEIEMEAELYDSERNLCASSEATFFLYPPEIAKRRFHYPGKEAF